MIQFLGFDNLKSLCVTSDSSILDAMSTLDRNGKGITLVVNSLDDMELVGIVTDGDLRRAILRNVNTQSNITTVMNNSMITGNCGLVYEEVLSIFLHRKINHLPIVDQNKKLKDLIVLKDLYQYQDSLRPDVAVVMAGGKGTRLYPLTKDTPKPMLKIGNKPILEIIVKNLKQSGITKCYLAVREHKQQIIDHFKDGKDFGLTIEYIHEEEIKNTAGALSLLPEIPSRPFIVMNGDLLTTINFGEMYRYHLEQNAVFTVAAHRREYKIPYGVLEIKDEDDNTVVDFVEKPTKYYNINAGIYIISPSVLSLIPSVGEFSIPDLVQELFKTKQRIKAFPILEYWKDIGHLDDFNDAQTDVLGLL